MDFRTTYGTLLKTQIEMYSRMYNIIERMDEANSCSLQLERLYVQLDETFEKANESMERIEQMSELCQQILSHPVYMRIIEIHILAEAKISEVMKKNSINR